MKKFVLYVLLVISIATFFINLPISNSFPENTGEGLGNLDSPQAPLETTSGQIDRAFADNTENIFDLIYGITCNINLNSESSSPQNPTFTDFLIYYDGDNALDTTYAKIKVNTAVSPPIGLSPSILTNTLLSLKKFLRYEGRCDMISKFAHANFPDGYSNYDQTDEISSTTNTAFTLREDGEVKFASFIEESKPITINGQNHRINWDNNKGNCEALGGAYLEGYITGEFGGNVCCGDDFIWTSNTPNLGGTRINSQPINQQQFDLYSLDPFDLSKETAQKIKEGVSGLTDSVKRRVLFENTLCLYQGINDGFPEEGIGAIRIISDDDGEIYYTCMPPEGHDITQDVEDSYYVSSILRDGDLLTNNKNIIEELGEDSRYYLYKHSDLEQVYKDKIWLRERFEMYPERQTDLGVYLFENRNTRKLEPVVCNYANVNGVDEFYWHKLDDEMTILSATFDLLDSNPATNPLGNINLISYTETDCSLAGGSWTGSQCCIAEYNYANRDYSKNRWNKMSYEDPGENNAVCLNNEALPEGGILSYPFNAVENTFVSVLSNNGELEVCIPGEEINLLEGIGVSIILASIVGIDNVDMIEQESFHPSCTSFETQEGIFMCGGDGLWIPQSGSINTYEYPWNGRSYCSSSSTRCLLPGGSYIDENTPYTYAGEEYICSSGRFIGPIGESWDWDYSNDEGEGTCAPEQCYINENILNKDLTAFETLNKAERISGSLCTNENNLFVEQHICEDRDGQQSIWTTRTKYAAMSLLELAKDEDNFILYCDAFERAANNIEEIRKLRDEERGNIDAEISDVCVLLIEDDVTVAIPLNPQIYSEANVEYDLSSSSSNTILDYFITLNDDDLIPDNCDNAILNDEGDREQGKFGKFIECVEGNEKFLFNNQLKILIFNKNKNLNSISNLDIDEIKQEWKTTLQNNVDEIKSEIDLRENNPQQLDPKLLNQFNDFSWLYVSKKNDQEIFATMERMGNNEYLASGNGPVKNNFIMSIKGFNIRNDDVCEYFVDEGIGDNEQFTSVCELNSDNNVYVYASMNPYEKTPLWTSVTGALRIND